MNQLYEASEGHLIPFILVNNAAALRLQMTVELSELTFLVTKGQIHCPPFSG